MLEKAARRYGAQLDIRWHAFELRPEPVPLPDHDSDYITEHWQNRVLPMAAERGLIMKVPRRKLRSRRALQAALFARAHGRLAGLDRELFRARFEKDADISAIDVLRRIGTDAGLDADTLADAVRTNSYLDELKADMTLAARLGISGVPAAVVGPDTADPAQFFQSAEPVAGAVPYEWLAEAIERALAGDRTHARLRRRLRAELPNR